MSDLPDKAVDAVGSVCFCVGQAEAEDKLRQLLATGHVQAFDRGELKALKVAVIFGAPDTPHDTLERARAKARAALDAIERET